MTFSERLDRRIEGWPSWAQWTYAICRGVVFWVLAALLLCACVWFLLTQVFPAGRL